MSVNGEGVHVALQDGKWQIGGVYPICTVSGTAAVYQLQQERRSREAQAAPKSLGG